MDKKKNQPFRKGFTLDQSENKPDDRGFSRKKHRDKDEKCLDLSLEKFQNTVIGFWTYLLINYNL